MLGQDIVFLRCHPAWYSRTLSAHTVICLPLITECSLRLPYSGCTAFLFGIMLRVSDLIAHLRPHVSILTSHAARTTHPFLLALRSPFGLISSAAIPPPAALCRRRDKAYSSSSTVFRMIAQRSGCVKYYFYCSVRAQSTKQSVQPDDIHCTAPVFTSVPLLSVS